MITRLFVCALAVVCTLTVLFLATYQSSGADFESDWLLEDLTCEELMSGYLFEVQMLDQIRQSYEGCIAYYQGSESPPHGDLHCALIKKSGLYVQGMANDIADVFNAKPECTGKK